MALFESYERRIEQIKPVIFAGKKDLILMI